MKANVFFLIAGFVFTLFSCSNDTKDVNTADTLYVIATRSDSIGPEEGASGIPPWIPEIHELLFTGDDIISFNIITREIVFTDLISDKLEKRDLSIRYKLSFYFNDKPLFDSISIFSLVSSYLYNDLVFVILDSKFYLEDAFPPIPFSWPTTDAKIEEVRKIRKENAEKRKPEWDIFIKYLSDAGKIINQSHIPTLPNDLNEMIAEIERIVIPLKEKMPETIVSQFETQYNAWVETWKRPEIVFHSNPKMYAQSEEYYSLLAFCKSYDKAIWPLVIEKSVSIYFNILLLEALTTPEYQALFDEIFKTIGGGGYNNNMGTIYAYLLLTTEEATIRQAVDALVK